MCMSDRRWSSRKTLPDDKYHLEYTNSSSAHSNAHVGHVKKTVSVLVVYNRVEAASDYRDNTHAGAPLKS